MSTTLQQVPVLNDAFFGLEPQTVLAHFSEILKIPRRSHEEDQMVAYIQRWADSYGYTWKVDDHKNIVVFVPATTTCTHLEPICYQAHTDMVCVGDTHWPIEIEIRDGWVGTLGRTQTLGADNGLGCAMMMALAEEENHGPLELLFTSDEEDDFSGCEHFDRNFFGLKARYLVNLDTPHFGRITIASAGFRYLESTLQITRTAPVAGKVFMIEIEKMPGGHSGEDVHQYRGNALKLMGQVLSRLPKGWKLIDIEGGEKGNSIPQASMATILLPDGVSADFQATTDAAMYSKEILRCAEMQFDITPISSHKQPMADECQDQIVSLLLRLPNGVKAMSYELEELPELSTTPSLLQIKAGDILWMKQQIRGATDNMIDELATSLQTIYQKHGFTSGKKGSGRSWIQNKEHRLIKSIQAAFAATDYEGILSGNHGAIEPGALCGDPANPAFDAAGSFGVWIKYEHKETEQFSLVALEKTWNVVKYLASNPLSV
ncbi:M20/M25/M40 family metallo-hydrolase [Candidatus Peribacteria bacterium]|nr:MAG: M20/M25/M40 family metallo-hydrolase [Candidatus Peribacteria bacterium]